MNYQELAGAVARSPSTVKKWRSRIEEISDYSFTKEKTITGSRKNYKSMTNKRHVQVLYNFSDTEVEKFIQLSQLIAENGLDEAIRLTFGDKKKKAFLIRIQKEREYLSKVDKFGKAFEKLDQRLIRLEQEDFRLTERLTQLENQKHSVFNRSKK